jgi:hypothetical protein
LVAESDAFGEEIVHIIPLGHEFDRAVKPFEKYKANRAYLLATTRAYGKYSQSMTKEQEWYVKKVEEYLKRQKISVERIDVDLFDTLELAKCISTIITKEKGNRIYVNISSAGRLTSVIATLAAMAHSIKAYYVEADGYTSSPEDKQAHGISICNNLKMQTINNLPLQLPSDIELKILIGLFERGDNMNMVEIEKYLGSKNVHGYENCAEKSYPRMSRKDRINCHMKLKGILEKLETKGYISMKKAGKNRLSKIEPTGIFIAHISGQTIEKKMLS